MSEAELRATLREPPGGTVKARVRALDGVERDVTIVPDSVVDPSVRHARILDGARGVGYLAVTSFSNETPQEFDRAIDFLRSRGMRGLILDLRHDFGGVLEAAVRIADRFLSEGTIVSTEGRGDPIVYRATEKGTWLEGTPVVVLVDRDTASASEVLAGALQDHRAAVLVGEPTYGKGMVQTIRAFEPYGTRAKVTSSYYYSPNHRNFERSADHGREFGLLPDLELVLNDTDRSGVHAHLADYSPGPEAIPDLESWEAREGVALIDPMPSDPQLAAALGLLLGERPGPGPIER